MPTSLGMARFAGYADPDLTWPFLCQLRWAWHVLRIMLWPPAHPDLARPVLCQLRWAWHVLRVMLWPPAHPDRARPFLCQLRWAWHVLRVTLALNSHRPFCANFGGHGTFCGLCCGRPRTLHRARPFLCQLRWAWHVLRVMLWPPAHPHPQGPFCANFAGHGTFCGLR